MSVGRFVAAGAVFFSCYLFGAVRKARLNERLAALENIIADLSFMEQCVRLNREKPDEIMIKLAKHGKCREMWARIYKDDVKTDNTDRMISALEASDFNEEARIIIREHLSSQASSDSGTAAATLRNTLTRLENILSDERKKTEQKTKLFSALSLLAGAASALLLL